MKRTLPSKQKKAERSETPSAQVCSAARLTPILTLLAKSKKKN
jgi:hypothetical protein